MSGVDFHSFTASKVVTIYRTRKMCQHYGNTKAEKTAQNKNVCNKDTK